jgi:hypothetical protein
MGIDGEEDCATATDDDNSKGKLTITDTTSSAIIVKFLTTQVLEGEEKVLFLFMITHRSGDERRL